ncbi:MAG: DNA-methyltransferase [Candidatus Heimdallarchaeota archaeon]
MKLSRARTMGQFSSDSSPGQSIVQPSFFDSLRPKASIETDYGMFFNNDCEEIISMLPSNSMDVIFADPPYNIGKIADWDKFPKIEDYVNWCKSWIISLHRILKDTGSLFIMGFSEILALVQAAVISKFKSCRWLIWHYKNKPNLSKSDWVRSHEAILHLRKSSNFFFAADKIREPYNIHTRKYPERTQGKSSQYGKKSDDTHLWRPNVRGAKPRDVLDIPAINNSMKEKTAHPTQKPEALLRKLLLGTCPPAGGVVFDPFAGSGTTLIVAEQAKAFWVGAEISSKYSEIIESRIKSFLKAPKSLKYWLKLDYQRFLNRMKVRGYKV